MPDPSTSPSNVMFSTLVKSALTVTPLPAFANRAGQNAVSKKSMLPVEPEASKTTWWKPSLSASPTDRTSISPLDVSIVNVGLHMRPSSLDDISNAPPLGLLPPTTTLPPSQAENNDVVDDLKLPSKCKSPRRTVMLVADKCAPDIIDNRPDAREAAVVGETDGDKLVGDIEVGLKVTGITVGDQVCP